MHDTLLLPNFTQMHSNFPRDLFFQAHTNTCMKDGPRYFMTKKDLLWPSPAYSLTGSYVSEIFTVSLQASMGSFDACNIANYTQTLEGASTNFVQTDTGLPKSPHFSRHEYFSVLSWHQPVTYTDSDTEHTHSPSSANSQLHKQWLYALACPDLSFSKWRQNQATTVSIKLTVSSPFLLL